MVTDFLHHQMQKLRRIKPTVTSTFLLSSLLGNKIYYHILYLSLYFKYILIYI